MRERPNVPEAVGARVGQALSTAETRAATLLADAERQAARVRPVHAGALRRELEQRIEKLETLRERVIEQRGRVPSRLEEVAGALTDISAKLSIRSSPGAEQPEFERVLSQSEGRPGDRHARRLEAIVKTAHAAAQEIVEDARDRARRSAQLARHEVEEVVSERRLARAFEPAAREAAALRRSLGEIEQALEQALPQPVEADDEDAEEEASR